MDDDKKTALSIGLITVYLGHAVLDKKISDRMKQMGAGTIGAGAYYVTSEAINRSEKLNNRKVLRNILEATAAVMGAYAGAKIGSYIQRVIDDYKSRKKNRSGLQSGIESRMPEKVQNEVRGEVEVRREAGNEIRRGMGREEIRDDNNRIINPATIDQLIGEHEVMERLVSPFLRTYNIIRLRDYQMITNKDKRSESFSDNLDTIAGVRYK